MARKKKHEEHENHERWLVSYADFITLLFATFVVLYALSQVDVAEFTKLEEALKSAFSNSVMDGSNSIMDANSNSLIDGSIAGQPNPLMLEYLSQKYEDTSFREIKDSVDKMKNKNLTATIDERGLVIKFTDNLINFQPGSAKIEPNGEKILAEIGDLIFSKFQIHFIQVEGHTDSTPTSPSSIYPTNWELSGARASSVVNFFINTKKLSPKMFVAMGFADTIPLKNSGKNPALNRRVEIVVVKNKNKSLENNDIQALLKEASAKTRVIEKKNPQRNEIEHVIEEQNVAAPEQIAPTKETEEIKNSINAEKARQTREDGSEMPSFLKD